MYTKKITVFTPTYNRAYIIKNVYDSLIKQKFNNYEWLVIDDGSTDNTSDLIDDFISENKIDIKYVKKENGGQHTALNMAIKEASGELLMIVDSDDYLTDRALSRVVYWESKIANKQGYAGVSGLKIYPSGQVIGDRWKHNDNYVDATNSERKKLSLLGDKAEVYYTDVLKKFYPIPVFSGENDVEKAVLWNRISYAGYKLRWFNEGIYVCQYLDDGMSSNIQSNHLKNFKGYTCWKKELIDMQKSYLGVIRETAAFTDMARRKGYKIGQMGKILNKSKATIELAVLYYKLHKLKMHIKH